MATHRVLMNPEGLRRKMPGMPMSFYRPPRPAIPTPPLDYERIYKIERQLAWSRFLVALVSEPRR